MNAPFLRSLTVRNLLSFDEEGATVELGGLNVLIGPNGSGKSNLLDALRVLKATPTNYTAPFLVGGVGEWIHKGGSDMFIARVSATSVFPYVMAPLTHEIAFVNLQGRAFLMDESIGYKDDGSFFFRYVEGTPTLEIIEFDEQPPGAISFKHKRVLQPQSGTDWNPNQSVLAQRRDPERLGEIAGLARNYEEIGIYSDWTFGRRAVSRQPQLADLDSDFLSEDGANLAVVLGTMLNTSAYEEIRAALARLNDRYTDLRVVPAGGPLQLVLREFGYDTGVPAARLSDGTLRMLQLLAILLNPKPRSLVCLEEPELGLHPDAIRLVADLIIRAKERMQVVITTHSSLLLTALQRDVDRVVVCERDRLGSRMDVLGREDLDPYLQKFELGHLWTSGDIGGVTR